MAPAAALDHVLAVAEAALRNWRPEPTGFLDPEERFAVEPVLQQRSGLHWRCYGGVTPRRTAAASPGPGRAAPR